MPGPQPIQDPIDALDAQYPSPGLPSPSPVPQKSQSSGPPKGGAAPGGPALVQPIPQAQPPASTSGIIPGIQKLWNRATDFSKPALARDASDAAGTAEAAPVAFLRAPGQLVGGVLDTSADAGRFVDDNINGALARGSKAIGAQGAADFFTQQQAAEDKRNDAGRAATKQLFGSASLADVLSLRQSLGKVGWQPGNQFLTQAVASVTGGEGTLASKAVATGIKAAVTASTEAPTAGARLGDRGVQGVVAAGLDGLFNGVAAKVAQARTAAVQSQMGELVQQRFTAGKTVAEATPAEAATDSLDRTFATARTTDARTAQAYPDQAPEPQEPEHVPGGTRSGDDTDQAPQGSSRWYHGGAPAPDYNGPLWFTRSKDDAEGWASRSPDYGLHQVDVSDEELDKVNPDARGDLPNGIAPMYRMELPGEIASRRTQIPLSPHPVSVDANAALEKAGLPERVPDDSPPLDAEGKVIVAPQTKSSLDNQGLGRAFAAPNEASSDPVIHLKEVGADGTTQRVVGSITPDDLDGLIKSARQYAAKPNTINTLAGSTSGQWNLRPLGTADDVSAFGRAIVDRLPEQAGPITNKMAVAAAKEMGLDGPGDAHIWAGLVSSKPGDLANGLTWARLQSAKINSDVSKLADTDWRTVPVDDPRWEAAKTAYHNGYVHMQAFRQAKSEVGRALQVMQAPLDGPFARAAGVKPEDVLPPQPVPDYDTWSKGFGKVPPEGRTPIAPGQLRPLPADPDEFDQHVKLWNIANKAGADAVNNFWKGLTFSPDAFKCLRTSLANWYTAGLVSRPSTFARDLVGPAVLGGLRTIEKSSGAIMQALYHSTLGDASKVPGLLAQSADAPSAYAQTFGDVGTSLKYAWGSMKSGESRLGGAQPYNFNSKGVPDALVTAAANGSMLKTQMFSMGNAINQLPQAIHALHGGVNELALRLSYLGEIRASAMMQARREGLEGDALSTYVKQAVTASEDPVSGQATDVSSLENAQRTTFTKPVGSFDTEPHVAAVARMLGALRENTPELRYIMPIFTVPANNLGETLRRVPVLGQMFRGTQQELSGSMGAIAQAEAYGRMMTGGAALAGGLLMARNGLMTGAGPAQAKDKAAWEASGFQPYSIKLGNEWVSYNKVDTLGSLLGIAGNYYDSTVYHKADDPTSHALAPISALAEYFKDQSNVQGIAELMQFGSNPSEDAGHLKGLLNSTLSGFVPGFVQTLRQDTDPDRRIAIDPISAIKNALPFASTTLDPTRNFLGHVVHVPNNAEGMLPLNFSPTNPQGPTSPILNELHRLYLATGYAPGVLPPGVTGAGLDQRTVKLEDGSSLYDARMRYRATVTNDDGDTLEQALTSTLNSDDYKNGYDGSPRGEKSSDDDQQNRTEMVEKVFTQFDKLAKQQVAQDSPIAAKWLAAAMVKQRAPPGSAALHTGDIATNPALGKALGINMDDYISKVTGQ